MLNHPKYFPEDPGQSPAESLFEIVIEEDAVPRGEIDLKSFSLSSPGQSAPLPVSQNISMEKISPLPANPNISLPIQEEKREEPPTIAKASTEEARIVEENLALKKEEEKKVDQFLSHFPSEEKEKEKEIEVVQTQGDREPLPSLQENKPSPSAPSEISVEPKSIPSANPEETGFITPSANPEETRFMHSSSLQESTRISSPSQEKENIFSTKENPTSQSHEEDTKPLISSSPLEDTNIQKGREKDSLPQENREPSSLEKRELEKDATPIRVGTIFLPQLKNSFNPSPHEVDTIRSQARNSIQASLFSGIQTLLSIVGALSLLTLAAYGIFQYSSSPARQEGGLVPSIPSSLKNPMEVKETKKDSPLSSVPSQPVKTKAPIPQNDPAEVKKLTLAMVDSAQNGLNPPFSPEILMEKAKENPQTAQAYYKIAAQQGSPQALHQLGQQSFFQGDYGQAEGFYQKSIEKGIQDPSPYNNLALLYQRQGKNKEAGEALQKAMERGLKSPELFNTMGNWAREEKKNDEAIQNYKKALEIQPLFYPSLFNLAELLVLQGEFEEALKYYGKISSLPEKKEALEGWNGMARIYLLQREYSKAQKALETALTLAPNPPVSLLENLAVTYASLENYIAALKVMEELKEPTQSGLYNKALLYLHLKNYKKAKETLQAVIGKNSKHKNAYFSLAMVSESEGDFYSAIGYYEEVLKIDPHEAKAYNNIGLIYLGGEENQKAIDYFSRGIQNNPYYSSLYLNRGLAYTKIKQKEKALADLEKYLQIDSPPAQMKEKISALLEKIKNEP